MKRLLARSLTIALAALALAGVVAQVRANQTYLSRLPSSASFGCANCHVGATATQAPSVATNPFGDAFKTHAFTWDAALAGLDSDGDECANGVELGDADGNGQPDGHQIQQTSNPGLVDCQPNTFDETTWGALKSLFNTNK
jgi:hypothetical protein